MTQDIANPACFNQFLARVIAVLVVLHNIGALAADLVGCLGSRLCLTLLARIETSGVVRWKA